MRFDPKEPDRDLSSHHAAVEYGGSLCAIRLVYLRQAE